MKTFLLIVIAIGVLCIAGFPHFVGCQAYRVYMISAGTNKGISVEHIEQFLSDNDHGQCGWAG
jgi:hypothetical protein